MSVKKFITDYLKDSEEIFNSVWSIIKKHGDEEHVGVEHTYTLGDITYQTCHTEKEKGEENFLMMDVIIKNKEQVIATQVARKAQNKNSISGESVVKKLIVDHGEMVKAISLMEKQVASLVEKKSPRLKSPKQ